MTSMIDRMIERFDELENEYVIKNVKLADGTIEPIEINEDFGGIVEVEVIKIEEYEANGYDTEGLDGQWIEL